MKCVNVPPSLQGGYDAGYMYECAVGPEANGSEIIASEPLQALPIEDCGDVPVTCIKIRLRFISVVNCSQTRSVR